MQTITLLLLALAIYGTTVQGMTEELRQYALKLHNDYRKNVAGACQMERMQYDMDLERQATEWANKCVFKHEIIKGRGENLAWNSAKDPETDLMTNAAKSWYDEVQMYSYGQQSCGSSCHYTQMVWAKTNKVGCATKRCGYLTNAYADAWYFVCFYKPGGNMYGEAPYKKQCDTHCLEGQTEDSDGLCVGSGEETVSDEADNNGDDEEGETEEEPKEAAVEECEDKDSRCEGWAKSGECTKNPNYMHRSCRPACALCGDVCKDVHGRCAEWAGDSQCTKNAAYMLKYCKLSCNAC